MSGLARDFAGVALEVFTDFSSALTIEIAQRGLLIWMLFQRTVHLYFVEWLMPQSGINCGVRGTEISLFGAEAMGNVSKEEGNKMNFLHLHGKGLQCFPSFYCSLCPYWGELPSSCPRGILCAREWQEVKANLLHRDTWQRFYLCPIILKTNLLSKKRHYKYDWLLGNTNTFLLSRIYDSFTKRFIFYATLKAVIYRLTEYYSDAKKHANITILTHFCC